MDVATRSSGPNPYSNFAVIRLKESLWAGLTLGSWESTNDPVMCSTASTRRAVWIQDLFFSRTGSWTRTWREHNPRKSEWKQRCWRLADLPLELGRRNRRAKEDRAELQPGGWFCRAARFQRNVRRSDVQGTAEHSERPGAAIRRLPAARAGHDWPGFDQEWQNTFRAEFHNGAYTDDDIVDIFMQRITTPFHIYKNVFIPKRFVSLHPAPTDLRVGARPEVHVQLLRALWRVLRRHSERVSHPSQLPSHSEILDRRLGDVGPFSPALAQWEFFRRSSKPARKLLVQPVSDVHEPRANGHVKRPSREREPSPSLQLPPDSDLYVIYNVERSSPASRRQIRHKCGKHASRSNGRTLGSHRKAEERWETRGDTF